MIYLKNFQNDVVDKLSQFFKIASEEHENYLKAKAQGFDHAWLKKTFGKLALNLVDEPKTGLNEEYPRIILKIPTGGGKTLLAVEAIREYQNLYAKRRNGLIVWIVPSETIYSQTLKNLRDKGHHYRQLLDQCSGNRTLIIEKGQKLSQQDLQDNLVILFVMIQSVNRKDGKEGLKVFHDSGGYEGFFPADHRYDEHKQWIEKIPNLDIFSNKSSVFPQIITSLGNAIRVSNPLIIIDEIHKVFSDTARETINNLNPAFVLGLSATPKVSMNILVRITGLQLKEEEMVKLDMHLIPPKERHYDWRMMLADIKKKRDALEKKAIEMGRERKDYVRPIALIQVEATGNDQRGRGRVHSQDAREELMKLGIPDQEIAIKTSAQNDIEDVDLFSRECSFRYIITKEALREGWDCSFAYILGIIPNVQSNTSMTQLIGRILRQPNAKKFQIPELDESYVYYTKGSSTQLLKQIQFDFKKEGLEDLLRDVRLKQEMSSEAYRKTVAIKKSYAKRFGYAFYLPVWLMIGEGNQRRRFNYDIDIKPYLDFHSLSLNEKELDRITSSLSDENVEMQAFRITLDSKSKTKSNVEYLQPELTREINISYATRRLADEVENAFISRTLAESFLSQTERKVGSEKLKKHFGYIVSLLVRFIVEYRQKKEEQVFREHMRKNTLVLAVTNDEETGYRIPPNDQINDDGLANPFQSYLYDDVELPSLNSLETKVAELLDDQEKLLWWFRNKVSKQGYAIQGWRKNKIRPDFVAAKKGKDGGLELVYVIEAKGEQLLGNPDTTYKSQVLEEMSKTPIKPYQTSLEFEQFNEKVEFYLVADKKEEEEIRKKFK